MPFSTALGWQATMGPATARRPSPSAANARKVEISLSDKDERVLLALTPEEIAAEQITLEIAGLCEACRPAKAT